MRFDPPQPNRIAPWGELLSTAARARLEDFAIQTGTGQADHHPLVVERTDRRRHRLIPMAKPIQHIGEHRGVQLLGNRLEKTILPSKNHAVASVVRRLPIVQRVGRT
jgi:hypothetical protein